MAGSWLHNNPDNAKRISDKRWYEHRIRTSEQIALQNRARVKAWRESYPEKAKFSSFKKCLRKYDITFDDYILIHERQKGLCKICKTPIKAEVSGRRVKERACVDHDHVSGRIRGLLCHRCNIGMGYYEGWYADNRISIYRYLAIDNWKAKLRARPQNNVDTRKRDRWGRFA